MEPGGALVYTVGMNATITRRHVYEPQTRDRPAFEHAFSDVQCAGSGHEGVLLSWLPSPVGPLLAGATGTGICCLEFTDAQALPGQVARVAARFNVQVATGTNEHLELLMAELAEYFAGTRRSFSVPLSCTGTPFQRRVWQQLKAIPYGTTCSYEEVAVAIGQPRAARAVGHANGLNHIAIVIPCHRVIAKDGTLGGYGGGLWRKQHLLALESGRVPPS